MENRSKHWFSYSFSCKLLFWPEGRKDLMCLLLAAMAAYSRAPARAIVGPAVAVLDYPILSSRYLDKIFLRASRESLSLSFAPGIQTKFFFALRAKVFCFSLVFRLKFFFALRAKV